MKRSIKKIAIALTMAVALGATTVATTGTTSVQAASKKKVKTVKFKAKTYYVQVKKSKSLAGQLVFTPKKVNSKKATWKSYKKSVATVTSSGKVKAKKVGTAKIRAISKSNKKKKAYTNVKVRYNAPKVTLNTYSATKNVGETVQLTASKVSTSKYYVKSTAFTTSNAKVATVTSSGKVTAVGAGTATITVKRTSFSSSTKTFKITVNKPADPTPVDPTTYITEGKTYSNLSGDVVVKGSATGNVTINDSKIDTLTMENGNYNVAVNNTTITTVKSVDTYTKKAINGAPTLTLGSGATIATVNNTTPMNVVMNDASAKITSVNVQEALELTQNVTPTIEIGSVNVATAAEVSVAVPTTTVNVATGNANITVAAKVANVTVNATEAKETASVVKLAEGADVATVTSNTPIALTANTGSKVASIVAKAETTIAGEAKVGTVTVDTASVVKVTAPSEEIAVQTGDAKVTVAGNTDKVTVSADTTTATPAIKVEAAATITEVNVTGDTTKVDVSGAGTINKVTVPESLKDNAQEIVVPDTVEVVTKDDQGQETIVKPATKVYVDVTKTENDGMTTFVFPVDSEYYKISKDGITSSVTSKDIKDLMGYFYKPADAYKAWINPDTTLPLDGSGTVTINSVQGNVNAKDVVVTGTSKAGTYRVVLTQDGTNYKLVVTDKDGKVRTATITPGEEQSTLVSSNYTVVATETTVEVTRKSDDTVVLTAKKEDGNYTVSALTEKVGNTNIQYLKEIPQS